MAARGLDFPAVTHILQFDPPGEPSEYVQRVGRTARMGRRGVAILFLAQSELAYTEELEAVGVPLAQQKLFPSLATLPRPPALSKRAAAETDSNRRTFQVAMDAAHLCQVCLPSASCQCVCRKAQRSKLECFTCSKLVCYGISTSSVSLSQRVRAATKTSVSAQHGWQGDR